MSGIGTWYIPRLVVHVCQSCSNYLQLLPYVFCIPCSVKTWPCHPVIFFFRMNFHVVFPLSFLTSWIATWQSWTQRANEPVHWYWAYLSGGEVILTAPQDSWWSSCRTSFWTAGCVGRVEETLGVWRRRLWVDRLLIISDHIWSISLSSVLTVDLWISIFFRLIWTAQRFWFAFASRMVRVFLLKLLERSSNKDRAWFQNLPSCWTVHSEDLLRLSWLVNGWSMQQIGLWWTAWLWGNCLGIHWCEGTSFSTRQRILWADNDNRGLHIPAGSLHPRSAKILLNVGCSCFSCFTAYCLWVHVAVSAHEEYWLRPLPSWWQSRYIAQCTSMHFILLFGLQFPPNL